MQAQLSRTIVSILAPIVKQQPYNPSLDYSEWRKLFSATFNLHSKKLKKSRSIQVCLSGLLVFVGAPGSLFLPPRGALADVVSAVGKHFVPL